MLRPRRFSSASLHWRRRSACLPRVRLPVPRERSCSSIPHNGANDGSINRQVANGRGGTKECQTTGTTTDAGYPEHTFNWDVVLRIREELSRLGVRTAMSRGNDNALGPCVDQRAAMANALRPDAIVSIHDDGGPPDGRGFHVNYSNPPVNDAQSGGAAIDLSGHQRSIRPRRPGGAESCPVPVDPDRTGQHEERAGRGRDRSTGGPGQIRRGGCAGNQRLPGAALVVARRA